MKRLILLAGLFFLAGCEIGNFPESRNRLHDLNHETDYCQKNPDRCTNDVPW